MLHVMYKQSFLAVLVIITFIQLGFLKNNYLGIELESQLLIVYILLTQNKIIENIVCVS